jgi:predicted unusual protein kinase regulating ubiquinone biosynthesis (AarF/ABC1/UbiB family)
LLFNVIHRLKKYSRIAGRRGGRDIQSLFASRHSVDMSLGEQASALRKLLQGSGPLYSSFALYLSSRIDLLSAEYCRELALTPDAAPALSAEKVDRIMHEHLGPAHYQLFRQFESVPARSGLITQTHRAVLLNGEAVSVTVLRPEFAVLRRNQPEQIALANARTALSEFAGPEVIEDFLGTIGRATDLELRSRAYAIMAADPDLLGMRRMPRFYAELSGQQVLTLSRAEETFLDQRLQAGGVAEEMARDLCRQWLRNTLCSLICPVDARLDNIAVTPQSASIFYGNEFIELPQDTAQNLRQYLLATLVDDPDRAARYLLQEMRAPAHGVDDLSEFQSKFRQAAYFGTLEPILGTDTNALAQLVFQHWRTALDHGYVPTPALLGFYRGLFSIARVGKKLAPSQDPLREGLEELNAMMAIEQFNAIAGTSYWTQTADKLAMAIVDFPRALDEALNRAERPDTNPSRQANAASRDRRSPWFEAIFLIAAIAFILRPSMHSWTETGAVFALLFVGLAALKTRH